MTILEVGAWNCRYPVSADGRVADTRSHVCQIRFSAEPKGAIQRQGARLGCGRSQRLQSAALKKHFRRRRSLQCSPSKGTRSSGPNVRDRADGAGVGRK
jgi:hypothetical protein